MYGNGAQIGMATTAAVRRPILWVLTVVLTECIVAVAGSTMRGAVARRFATTMRTTTAATTLASAWCSCNSSKKESLDGQNCEQKHDRVPCVGTNITPRLMLVSSNYCEKQHQFLLIMSIRPLIPDIHPL